MIKVSNKMYKRFLEIMDDYGEPLFGDNDFLKKQLEMCLNSQGYWSGCAIRVYYDKDSEDFRIVNRF